MSKMISVASGFQYSVNIGYDLHNDDKLKNFIPTKAALELLEEVLLSTIPTSTERARILIGAYGKGKSHIVLTILSMLMRKDRSLFEKLIEKISDDQRLLHTIDSYYESNKSILPVIITGSSTSLTQAFLLALQRTLSDNGLMDIMPETNYKAAIQAIERWHKDYPETYTRFTELIRNPIDKFLNALEMFDPSAYEEFEHIYPMLTAGSVFNPFLGFDVVELYENAARGLRKKGYSGIYVVYDEFSKYLEANITEASVSDIKMLQDFAEKCSRSGDTQMHIMLISHKEIANYIDKLPKQKVDGWRGVSERFKHIHLNNNFSQTYEIIGSVINKSSAWQSFINAHDDEFGNIHQRYCTHPIFSDVSTAEYGENLKKCYPLHPVSMYVLPRLSERVAQNERTLFTFLSAEGASTLSAFLKKHEDDRYLLLPPDLIYDYFEPLFRKEAYEGNIHKVYLLTTSILDQLENESLECKIVKTISLIYILEQFERLKPTSDEIMSIYANSYTMDEIQDAIQTLVKKKFLVYRKRSNNYLQLKQSSGINIRERINDVVESQRRRTNVVETLNSVNFDSYVYPSQYNDEHDMTRYFAFEFVTAQDISSTDHIANRIGTSDADGIIFGVLPSEEDSIESLSSEILARSQECQQAVFVLPQKHDFIEHSVRELNAVTALRDEANGDKILFDEYEIVYEDLVQVVNRYISTYTHPELSSSRYIHDGKYVAISRKAGLTKLVSEICDEVFPLTPVISNEVINRNEPTSIATNSRTRIVAALLRTELEPNLGLAGTRQEVSIMRSTLLRTGILDQSGSTVVLNLVPKDEKITNMLAVIESFILEARHFEKLSFEVLYDRLTGSAGRIGLRKGLIPIYLAVVLHGHKQKIVITDRNGQVTLNSDALNLINLNPANFFISHVDWDSEKERAVRYLEKLFAEYIIEAEKNISAYDHVANAMRRWYMALPRYAKECRIDSEGNRIDKRYVAFLRDLRVPGSNYQLLFKKLPKDFAYEEFSIGLTENIEHAVSYFNGLLPSLSALLIRQTKEMFSMGADNLNVKTLSSVARDWTDKLDKGVFEQLFADGTERILGLLHVATNDDETLIARIAKAVTGLRLEDWDSNTLESFKKMLQAHKDTAESFTSSQQEPDNEDVFSSDYKVSFVDDDGKVTTKRFERIERSRRSQLLYNQVRSALSAMGQSITEQEKRQVLIEILKDYC